MIARVGAVVGRRSSFRRPLPGLSVSVPSRPRCSLSGGRCEPTVRFSSADRRSVVRVRSSAFSSHTDPKDTLLTTERTESSAERSRPRIRRQRSVSQRQRSSIRSGIGTVFAAVGFVVSSLKAYRSSPNRAWMEASLEAIRTFLRKTKIDHEISTSLVDRHFFTNLRILRTCQNYDKRTVASIQNPLEYRMDQVRRHDQCIYGHGRARAHAHRHSHDQQQQQQQQHTNDHVDDVHLAVHLYKYMKYATAAYGGLMIQAAQVESTVEQFITLGFADDSLSPEAHPATDLVSGERQVIAKHVGVNVKDILVLHDEEPTIQGKDIDAPAIMDKVILRHFVAVDHADRAVVLAVRGTFSLQEVLVDLAGFTKPFCGGEGHSEMVAVAKDLWELVGDTVVNALKQYPDYKLVMTGHSLGGGTSNLLHIWMHSVLEQRQRSESDTDNCDDDSRDETAAFDVTVPAMDPPLPEHVQAEQIQCYTFGGPPVFYTSYYDKKNGVTGDADDRVGGLHPDERRVTAAESALTASSGSFVTPATSNPLSDSILNTSTHVIHAYDCIPFMSVDSIRRLLFDIRTVDEYWNGKVSSGDTFSVSRCWMMRHQMALNRVDKVETEFREVLDALLSHPALESAERAPTLFVPTGRTVWILPEGEDYVMEEVDPITLSQTLDIYLHPKMGTDHFPSQYEVALSKFVR